MKNKMLNINSLDEDQRLNYIKNLFFNTDISSVLYSILKEETKKLLVIKSIIKVLDDNLIINRIKEVNSMSDIKSVRLCVYSKIISNLSFYNKMSILNKFFKLLSEKQIKDIAFYEYQNKTQTSYDNKIFDKYCLKYKNEALFDSKSNEEILLLTSEIDDYNELKNITKPHKKKKPLIISLLIIVVITFMISSYYYVKGLVLIDKYKESFYPGIYLNDTNLSGKKVKELSDILEEEKTKIQNGIIMIINGDEKYEYTYKQINVNIDTKNVQEKILKYYNSLSYFQKLKMIKNGKTTKTFYLKGTFSDEDINSFINELKVKFNTDVRNDVIVIDDNHNFYYDKGTKGFLLDEEKTREKIKNVLSNLKEKSEVTIDGTITPNEVKYDKLSSINKKISSYTTSFLNSGNRGHNITLASKRLNGTIVMPGEIFSYLKVVGPYGSSNGYLPASVYLNGSTATENGGGVCQLATTTYMAQLKAGLETVSRKNHTFAPTYVPKGLDATVYSNTTDYKFKNNYEYPLYIISYIDKGNLTVDIWSNENALGGKTFEPYSVYNNGSWLSYLKVIQDGKVIETKYLSKSVYKTH